MSTRRRLSTDIRIKADTGTTANGTTEAGIADGITIIITIATTIDWPVARLRLDDFDGCGCPNLEKNSSFAAKTPIDV